MISIWTDVSEDHIPFVTVDNQPSKKSECNRWTHDTTSLKMVAFVTITVRTSSYTRFLSLELLYQSVRFLFHLGSSLLDAMWHVAVTTTEWISETETAAIQVTGGFRIHDRMSSAPHNATQALQVLAFINSAFRLQNVHKRGIWRILCTRVEVFNCI
jgi:hypothetical protein